MDSIPFTLHIQGQLGRLLLDHADHIEVAGRSQGGRKGDGYWQLTASRDGPTAGLKDQYGLPTCSTSLTGSLSHGSGQ